MDYQYVWFTGTVFRIKNKNLFAFVHSIGNELHIYVNYNDALYNPDQYFMRILNCIRYINDEMKLSAREYVVYKKAEKKRRFQLHS